MCCIVAIIDGKCGVLASLGRPWNSDAGLRPRNIFEFKSISAPSTARGIGVRPISELGPTSESKLAKCGRACEERKRVDVDPKSFRQTDQRLSELFFLL